jgi:hypothetical protein
MRMAMIAVPVLLGLGAATQAHAACTPIKFAAGTTGADVEGVAPPEDVLCYSLETGNGQTATVRVAQGRNIIFSILDMVDAQDNYTFTTEAKTYEIIVGQLMRSVTDEPFTLEISVTGP